MRDLKSSSFNQNIDLSYLGEKQAVIVQAKSFQGNIRKNIYVTEQIITLLLGSIKVELQCFASTFLNVCVQYFM